MGLCFLVIAVSSSFFCLFLGVFFAFRHSRVPF